MQDPTETWSFEVILLELVNIPVKVIERGTVPKIAATRDFAKQMFLDRFFDETYAAKHRRLKPEGVRIVDAQNNEVVRFTVGDFYTEAGFKSGDKPRSATKRLQIFSMSLRIEQPGGCA